MSRFASSSRGALRCRRGIATLEFALIGTMFFTALFASVELARYVGTRTALRAATGEVARMALTDSALVGCSAPKTMALARTRLLSAPALSVCVTRAATTVTVQSNYTFNFLISAFNRTPRSFAATVQYPL